MAVDRSAEVQKIVSRCRRIGWPVETGKGTRWKYRITMPNGDRVQIHGTPSDRNWRTVLMRQLEAGGFTEAEAAWLRADEAERHARIDADRRNNETKAAKQSARRDHAVTAAAGEYAVRPVDVNWLLTPAALPQTRTVLMTPEAAAKVLDTINTRNRQRRDNRVGDFVAIITDGEWGLTHQGVAIDTAGVLQDGQHRLMAIVETGETLPMQVSVGMPAENFRKVDTPLQRTARDAAWMRGETHVTALTAAARMILHLDKYGAEVHTRGGRTRTSIDQTDRAIIAMGDELRHAVRDAQRIRREVRCNASALATAIYKIRTRLPEGDPRVAAFFEQLETGIGITKANPVWLLRRLLIRTADIRGHRMSAWETLAYIVKAWNHTASGAAINHLVWRTNEGFPHEPFLPPPIEEDQT